MSFFDWPTTPIARGTSRVALYILLASLVVYLLGRWDARVSAEAVQLEKETRQLLATIRATRGLRDSLAAIEDSLRTVDAALAEQERRAVDALAALDAVEQTEVDNLEGTPVDSLLRPLRLRALRITDTEVRDVYATDATGVRFLAGRMLRLAQVERRVDTLELVARTRANRITVLQATVTTITTARDSLQSQLDVAAPLLERYLEQSKCRILWLVPCPSRAVTFAIGAVGGAAVVLAIRE